MNDDNRIYWWIPFGLNFILYGVCCLMIVKRKTFTIISLRSPTLYLITILGNFFMSLVLILYKIIGPNFFTSFYYLFRMLMIVSFILRYERIILCCGINKNDAADIQQFYTRRYLYIEKYYVRILMVLFALFLVITIVFILTKLDYFEAFFTQNNNENNKHYIIKIYIWVVWSFIEQIILVTYLFRTYDIISPRQFVKFELYSFLIICFLYSSFSFWFAFINNNIENDSELVLVSLASHYIYLLLNGYLPVIMSFTTKTLVTYHFTFKLMNNLYLFLTNETCYSQFNNYLISKEDNGSFYLKLYTHIMKYKLDFVLNINNELIFNSAIQLNNTFFENEENARLIEPDIVYKIKKECKLLTNNTYNRNLFDEALQYAYNELTRRFNEFKKSREYNELRAKITLSSYIRCKMCNIGLINKF